MKKIVIDGKCLNTKNVSGIERVYVETLKRMDCLAKPGEIEILVPNTYKDEDLPKYKNLKIVKYGRPIKAVWRQIILPFYIIKNHAIGFHLNNTAPILKPDIVVWHDINSIVNPDFFNQGFFKRKINFYSKKTICKRAKRLITDSEFTRSEVLRTFSCKDADPAVVYLGWQHYEDIQVDEEYLNQVHLKKHGYYFAMSSLAPNKNFKWVMEAAKYNPDSEFVIAGAARPLSFGYEYTSENLKGVKYLGYVTDSQAKTLMKYCKAFLYPSFYEGFGIPPLEALSAGANIIISDIPCLREVFGDSAYYVDPKNPHILLDDLMDKSKENEREETLSKYSWDATAEQYYHIITAVRDSLD